MLEMWTWIAKMPQVDDLLEHFSSWWKWLFIKVDKATLISIGDITFSSDDDFQFPLLVTFDNWKRERENKHIHDFRTYFTLATCSFILMPCFIRTVFSLIFIVVCVRNDPITLHNAFGSCDVDESFLCKCHQIHYIIIRFFCICKYEGSL